MKNERWARFTPMLLMIAAPAIRPGLGIDMETRVGVGRGACVDTGELKNQLVPGC